MNETNKQTISDMSEDILATSQDLNAILASGDVNINFRTHFVDTARNITGIEQLIRTILTENGAIFPKDSHLSEMRNVVIAKAMTTKDIEKQVRKCFGFERYPNVTLRVYLSTRMKDVCMIPLSGIEDPTAKTRPHRKYYLAE